MLKRLLLALPLLLAAPVIRAQSTDLIFDNFSLGMSLDASARDLLRYDRLRAGGVPAGPTAARGPASLRYTPTAALRQQAVASYAAQLRPRNAAGAQAITATFGPGKSDYDQVFATLSRGSGLPANDVASALAAHLLMGWMIVHNVQDGAAITVPIAQGVRNQFAPGLGRSLAGASPAALAQLGEELKLRTVVLYGGWQAAAKSHTLTAYQQGVEQLFKTQYGLPLSQATLTSQGLGSR
ncbi:hypothetical protein [Hymenobacter ruricola]|uniref:Uncharacterized protein n=1 Tax=Hymenobacter ruricola TaxID=2791023 RepID=A0ABS0I2W2_9BACT|nr:hypothetical protein [Hymenobacter ruricola]MBF9221280.1 hypothetical protein [Hymenobacter ruricola]